MRIWRAAYGTRSGLSLTPIFVLDTLATHILTMHCYLSLKDEAVIQATAAHDELVAELEQVGLSTADILKGHDHGKSVFTHARMEELMNDENNAAFIDPHQPNVANVFVAGGTNLGCVYIWKFSYGELYNLIAKARPAFSADLDVAQLPIDDGLHLYSLLQSSSAAIVHVSISSVLYPLSPNIDAIARVEGSTSSNSKRCIVLTTSDTQRIVRTHCDCGDSSALTNTTGASFVLCGESIFESTVVSCHFFENPQPEDVLSRLRRPQTGDEHTTGKQRHELDHMVSTSLVENFLHYFESKRRERRKRRQLEVQVAQALSALSLNAPSMEAEQVKQEQQAIMRWLEQVERDDTELRCAHLLACTSNGDIYIFLSDELTRQSLSSSLRPSTATAAAAAAAADQQLVASKGTNGTSSSPTANVSGAHKGHIRREEESPLSPISAMRANIIKQTIAPEPDTTANGPPHYDTDETPFRRSLPVRRTANEESSTRNPSPRAERGKYFYVADCLPVSCRCGGRRD